jgi:hypothetical protein
MTQVLQYPSKSGSNILVDISVIKPKGDISEAALREDIFKFVEIKFEDVLDGIKPITNAIIGKFQELSLRPDELQVEFGIRFNASGNIIVTSGGFDANLKVALKWSMEQ